MGHQALCVCRQIDQHLPTGQKAVLLSPGKDRHLLPQKLGLKIVHQAFRALVLQQDALATTDMRSKPTWL